MTSASRVSRFSTRKSAWWTAWWSAWPLKRWLSQMNSWSQILQIVGGSYYFIPESAMGSPPYTLLGTQALDGIGMQLLWVSDIAIIYSFCLISGWKSSCTTSNVGNILWVFEWPCEYLKDNCQLTAIEELISKCVKHCVSNATTHRIVETIWIGAPWYHYTIFVS